LLRESRLSAQIIRVTLLRGL